MIDKLHAVRKHGNAAAHEGNVSVSNAVWLVEEAYYLGAWLFMSQGNGSREDIPQFQPPSPEGSSVKAEFKEEQSPSGKARLTRCAAPGRAQRT